MDKETIALIDEVRKQLIDFGKQTSSSSVQKKTRKVTSQIIWDAESYVDELDNIKSTSKTDAEAIQRIRSLVRNSEEDALKAMTVLPDDTGHHIVQSRTGGDAFTDLPYSRSGPIVSRLSQKHQQKFGNTTGVGGNLPPEMSLSNAAHKFDDKATGFERESGIGKAIPKERTAHPKGTAGYANLKGVDMSSDQAIETALSGMIEEQQQAARTAAQSDFPRQQYLREASGNPELYKGPKPKELVLDPRDIKQSYLTLTKGGFKFKPGQFGASVVSEYGDAFDELTDGAITNTINKAIVNPVRQAFGQEPVGPYQKPDPQESVNVAKGIASFFAPRQIRGRIGAQKALQQPLTTP